MDVPRPTPDRARDQTGTALLSHAECERLLEENYVGRLAVVVDGRPRIYPMNYRYYEGALVMRTGEGPKLRALSTDPPVAFEIDGFDDTYQHAWSVVVEGSAEVVGYEEVEEDLRWRPLRPWAGGERDHWVRIRPDTISGRVI
jgi:uncharacterized protein